MCVFCKIKTSFNRQRWVTVASAGRRKRIHYCSHKQENICGEILDCLASWKLDFCTLCQPSLQIASLKILNVKNFSSFKDFMFCLNLQSYRGRQKFFNSLSVEEVGGAGEGSSSTPVSDATLKVTKGAKQANRWSGLWGTSHKVGSYSCSTLSIIIHQLCVQDQKMEGLVIQLDNYSRLGIPKLQHLSVTPDPAEDQVEEALYSLEENWTDIVERSSSLSERIKAQQTALWELISTELAYIRTLKVIQDVRNHSQITY